MPHTNNKDSSKSKSDKVKTMIIFVVTFAIIASVALIATRAASPNVALEPENSTPVSPAIIGSDSNASGSKFVQFKKAASGGGCSTTCYIIGSGDIAKGTTDPLATGNQIKNLNPPADAVLTFGDNAYESGTTSEFTSLYVPTWGSFKAKTYPSPGNHDYDTSGATGYYSFFNATATSINGHAVDGVPNKGYYAFDVGPAWRFYSLNTEANQSEANTWLASDLVSHPKPCVVAYWHQPAWMSPSYHGNNSSAKTYFTTLYNHNADIVFYGHNHTYERKLPINASGALDNTKGIVSLTVGTGGAPVNAYHLTSIDSTSANNTAKDTWGNILLTAHSDGTYKLDFLWAAGESFTDTYSGTCH
ncbi:MAG: metallophosphoesterase family protein [Candidatus Saccharimonadales bacterium]